MKVRFCKNVIGEFYLTMMPGRSVLLLDILLEVYQLLCIGHSSNVDGIPSIKS